MIKQEDDGFGFFRGLLVAAPISIVLWVVIIAGISLLYKWLT